MARLLATTEPDRLDPVLAGIEHAAGEALASMRRTVGILRERPAVLAGTEAEAKADGGAGVADRYPAVDLTTLADLVEGFAGPLNLRTELLRDPAVPPDLPHEVQAAAHRVTQEALTNVLRHAADATEVTVSLNYDDGLLRVTVRDNGRSAASFVQSGGPAAGLPGCSGRAQPLTPDRRGYSDRSYSDRSVVERQGGPELFADVGENGVVTAIEVHRGGCAEVDDGGDRPCERCRLGRVEGLAPAEQVGNAVLEAG
jgi:hypothetical protein